MSIQEWLDPEAADEVVADRQSLQALSSADPSAVRPALAAVPDAATPGRLARGVRATGRGLLTLVLFLIGAGVGVGAGFGYGAGLEKGPRGTDLLPSYADWPWFWWALLATVPVVLALAFWRRVRPLAFGYVLALPWQLALSLGWVLYTFDSWGFRPLG